MNKGKYISKIILFILLILFGIFLFVYGGYDDSPGAQLLGLVIVIVGIISLVKNKKKFTIENK
ncbi:MAG: hypothetical protein A2406_00330 [Candidatus Komeilibacteria bacterium RIFOXYC1_FULL_37_11]|uniref:Uncharacterized protein n=1 Tax=Candidatus Komeilibacteria bacterium RIFOXYC1_FULL_37_11 TaxID=1798555 RepID=A0A1G2BY25_9BACT|nr:MAG: hypothetical protein A2406_00330 [Candidatus Komeilibacteria bacterium RIFOXYC1_FULL_37_11]OGY95247.1 MAG: hypothetical protein A2611_00895 [Candidatus Komeilibacteria bacterium RIFOXYD1_FULL_37_29]